MSISKFGLSDQDDDSFHRWNDILRKYVHENALCRVATDFDAGLCKIRRVALVHQNMQILKDRQDEIEKNITSLQTNREFMLKYLQENIQTFQDQLNILDKKMTTIQNSIQAKTAHHSE